MNIVWRGNQHTNSSSRDGIKPIAIVNHITASTASSCDNWFRDPNNNVSSAHFLVTKKGEVNQYVDIKQMAWANGITVDNMPSATSALVKEKSPTNPNKYTISIEHEGNGEALTDAQLKATIELHKWIIKQVKEIYGVDISVNRKYIIGHSEIDPKRKPNCPGKNFPFDEIIKSLSATPSTDNTVSAWAKESVEFCKQKGFMSGDERGFRPKDNVTREELACIVKRLWDKLA